MAEAGVWDKFKAAFDEPVKGPYKPAPGLDPDKAKDFSAGLNGDVDQKNNSAMNRRLDELNRTR